MGRRLPGDVTLWLVHRPPDNAWKRRHHSMGDALTHRIDLDREPFPTVTAGGACGGLARQLWLEVDGRPVATDPSGKPPYRVPLVAEVAAAPRNGLIVVSTFSGGGGSSFGWEMAGFTVAAAVERDPGAAATYRLNHPGTVIFQGDVRSWGLEHLTATTGIRAGELDVLDGSPPCQPFSTAGKRDNGWREADAREDMFAEFARILRELRPRAFVAENVKGLILGRAKGMFLETLASLRASGYRVEARLVDAQWLGVPQHRERVIFVGAREDLGTAPAFPSPLPYRYSTRDAIGDLLDLDRYREQIVGNDRYRPVWGPQDRTSPTIVATRAMSVGRIGGAVRDGEGQVLHLGIPEIKRLCGFPDDYALAGSVDDQWHRLGDSVPPPMMAAVAAAVRDRVLTGPGAG